MKVTAVFESTPKFFLGSLLAILALFANAAWAQVGYVHQAAGDVRLQQGSGTAQAVK